MDWSEHDPETTEALEGERASAVNRFQDIRGDKSVQLSPWELKRLGYPINVARYLLLEDIQFRSDIAGGIIVVSAGYISDLASIPRVFWATFMSPSDPRIALGSWPHDLGYQKCGKLTLLDGTAVELSRKDCDAILAYEAMPDLLATKAQQHAVYQALRRFGHGWEGGSVWERLL